MTPGLGLGDCGTKRLGDWGIEEWGIGGIGGIWGIGGSGDWGFGNLGIGEWGIMLE